MGLLVPGLGFEPKLPEPESGVLPLDDPGMWENDSVKYDKLQELWSTYN